MQTSVKLTCLACGQVNRVPSAKLQSAPKCAKCGKLLADGTVASLDVALHDKAVRNDEVPLIVDYWAPWCGPCKMMAPEYTKASGGLRSAARFTKIDTEQHPTVSQRLNIRGIPLLILYKNGKEVERLPGARPASDIEAFVRRHI